VGLVRALAPGHKCIILDEPFSALHESMKRELWYLLKRLQHQYDLTLLVVTHDLGEAFFLGDSLSVMIGGKINQTGKRRDITDVHAQSMWPSSWASGISLRYASEMLQAEDCVSTARNSRPRFIHR
jgi:ABC-type proline/glycine betaine transport system ATPase subunit